MKDSMMRCFPDDFLRREQDMNRLLWSFHATLDNFASGYIPRDDFSMIDITRLITSLVSNQRPEFPQMKGGNWSLLRPSEPVPADVRVQFIFFPSYIAVSLLSLFHYKHPDRAHRIEGFYDALHRGVQFISLRELGGAGLEAVSGRNEAVKILIKGRVHHYVQENRRKNEACERMFEILVNVKSLLLSWGTHSCLEREIVDSLRGFPDIYLSESKGFSWRCSRSMVPVLLEVPRIRSEEGYTQCRKIGTAVALYSNISLLMGNAGPGSGQIVGEYSRLLEEIVTTSGWWASVHTFFHIIIREMEENDDWDIVINSSQQFPADRRVVRILYEHFFDMPLALAHRKYRIVCRDHLARTREHLFALNRHYYCAGGNTVVLSRGSVVDICFSKKVLRMELARIIDIMEKVCESLVSLCRM